MLMLQCPELVRSIADRYKDIVAPTGISYPLLCAYVAMTCYGLTSLCDLVRFAPWTASVSSLSRPLEDFDKQTLNRAMRRVSWSVLKRVRRSPDEWIFVVDTTKNLKRIEGLSGRSLWGDSNNVIFEGQNLLVVAAVNKRTGQAIPVAWAPCIKPSESSEGKTASALTLEILDALVEQGWPKLVTVFDSWFDGVAFMHALSERGFVFVIQLKTSRKLKLSPGPRARKHTFVEVFSERERHGVRASTRECDEVPKGWDGLRFASEAMVWLRDCKGKLPQVIVKVAAIYNRPREKHAFGYYATNDLTQSGVWLWAHSRRRWNIECLFRDLRQHMAWGKLASQSEGGADLSLFLPIAVIAFLRETGRETETIGQQLSAMRQREMLRSVEFIKKRPSSSLLDVFEARNDPERANRKPRSSAAEKEMSVGRREKTLRRAV